MDRNDILPDQLHIEKIREKLWNNSNIGQVAIMVGAGFSLNANKTSEGASSFMLWNELVSNMKNELYPYNKNNVNSATSEALKLASEYELVFGRHALDEFLIKSLPDNNYIPGSIHKKLLSLPWSDIFTTNYDTLLERTTNYIYDRKYSLVVTTSDIASACKPRIVKLHGSFPSYRPFIISEEDYRTYPSKFSPFINMVRQSIMENVLCLVGFSGDDPNFLNWIGWVKDTVGRNSNQIYFIGFVNQSQRRTLEARGIIPIDLSPKFPEDKYCGNDRYKKSLEWFLLNLEKGKKNNIREWPKLETYSIKKIENKNDLPKIPVVEYKYSYIDNIIRSCFLRENLEIETIKDVICEWRKIRLSYPGWIICPKEKREIIIQNTEYDNLLYHLDKLNVYDQLSLIYELNWRYEVSLTPLTEDIAIKIRNIIECIDPFNFKINTDGKSMTYENYELQLKNCDKNIELNINYYNLKKQWLDLAYSLLRFEREELNIDAFKLLKEKLINKIDDNSEYKSKLYYEDCMFALSIRDENCVRDILKKWDELNDPSILKIKRAGIYAEIGLEEKAETIAANALNEIRKNIVPGEIDVHILSQEGWAMLLLKAIKMNNTIQIDNKEYIKEYNERWQYLTQYNCNPWNEIEWMKDVLLMSNPNHNEQYILQGFDRGKVIRRFSFGEAVKEQINISYSFLRMIENIGIPHRFGYTSMFSKSATNAAKWISKYSESWALSTVIRCNAKDEDLDFIISRDRLYLLNDDKIRDYFNIFTKALDEAIDNEPLKGYNHIFYVNQINNISEILSRLIVRLDDEQVDYVYKIVLKMYKSLRIQRDHRVNKSLKTILSRIFRNMTNEHKISKLKELLEVDIEMEKQYNLNPQNYQVFLFNYIEILDEHNENLNKFKTELKDLIKENLDFLNSEDISIKDRALTRLRLLNKIGILSEEEKELFGMRIWENCKQDTFPKSDAFLINIYIELPIHKGIDRNNLYLNYIRNEEIPNIYSIKLDENGNESVSYSPPIKFIEYKKTCIGFIDNIYKNENFNYLKLTSEDARELLMKFNKFWQEQKKYLLKYKKTMLFDGENHIKNIIEFVSIVIIPNIQIEDKVSVDLIRKIKNDMESNGYNTIYMLPSLLRLNLSSEIEINESIKEYIISNDEEYVLESIKSLYHLMLINKKDGYINKNTDISYILINRMFYSKDNILISIVNTLESILNDFLIEDRNLIIESIIVYLKSTLKDLVNIDIRSYNIEIIDKIYYVSKLAKVIYDILIQDDKDIYKIIDEWRQYSLNSPLRDIRNLWK